MRALALASLLSACGAGLAPCDIRESSCQDDIFYAVLDVRGDTWDPWAEPPNMQVIDTTMYREYLEERYAQSSSDANSAWDDALTLVGLVDPDADRVSASIDSQVENTAAFYSPSTRWVTIIDHGEPTRLSSDTETLAHELVHALQDRYQGLRAIEGHAETTDEWFAARSIVEGEAVLVATLVMLGTEGRGFDDYPWESWFDLWRDVLDEDVAASPARFAEAVRRYVYPLGGQFVADAYEAGGNPAIQHWLYQPPASAAGVLRAQGGDGTITCTSRAPAGYEFEGSDALGAMGAVALLNDDAAAAHVAWAQARTWSADSLRVFQSPAHETAITWRLRWSSLSRAHMFADALAGRSLDWRLLTSDREVLIAAATDPAVWDTWDPAACE